MKYLSIDSSTVCCGYAEYDDNKLVKYGNYKSKNKDVLERMYELVTALSSHFKENQVLVIEEPSFIRINPSTSLKLNRLFGMILYEAHIAGLTVISVNPKSWKQKMLTTKKRVEQKLEAIELSNKIFNINITSNDTADAILIGKYYIEKEES